MARFVEPEAKHLELWRKWVASRPPVVRAIAEKLDPWTLYRIKESGHRCTFRSINENGTLTMDVTGQFNAVIFDREVFGIRPEDIEECELPAPDEPVGALLAPEEVEAKLDTVRRMAGIKPINS